MDEDAGIRAPMTRLRRRVSVEQTEESKSPAVNTPTMKRGGRKTAKPELELIDENTPDDIKNKRTTKKTATKDVTVPEEKPVTPARRSTRVKSNTSIISETALAVGSPRAKRATRRASLAGSDSDTPLTPIRQTRRTRKDSASSVEKEPQHPPKHGIQITDIIVEEPEVNLIKLTPQSEIATDQSSSPNSIRKSPRLLEKKNTSPIKVTVETVEESSNDMPVPETTTIIPTKTCSIILNPISLSSQDTADEPINKTDTQLNETPQNRLSIANTKLIKELTTGVTNKSNLNKSWSDADNQQITTKRQRTRSWTTLSASNNSQFYSDNESTKNKIKNSITSPSLLLNKSGSGDGSLNTSLNQSISNKSISKRKMKDSMNFVVKNINEPSDKITIDNNIEKKSENQTLLLGQNNKNNHDTIASELFEKEPSGDIKTIIYIEDSDSNSEKINIKSKHQDEDQCVPVVEHTGKISPIKVNSFTSVLDKNEQNVFNNKELTQRKDSEPMDCEPMDIDETMPENVIIPETETTELNTTGRKSTSGHLANLSNEDVLNKSGKKSSIIQSLDKSEIETKSTLILSQVTSTGDNAVESPQVINNKLLSKSVDDLNITQENDIKKNLSLCCSTSTPLQNKNINTFKETHANASISSTQNNQTKNTNKEIYNISKDQYKNISNPEDSELSEDENVKESIYTENGKNKGKGKKASKKETSIIQSESAPTSSKEKMENDENILNEYRSNVNDEDVLTHQQRTENKLEDVSLDKKSNKPVPKIKYCKKNESSSEESEKEIESDDDASEKSNLIIDFEALDAGYDYESGDSQDESERQYQKEHEVLDKGETLTTDEEFSDDSDYEKDSFTVSSNEEDDELLDGSDDDLSMSDKELKMTAKSKKKYNERKDKEQKEVSREMFESRHKLNSSNKSKNSETSKTKKNRRQQISSSESEDDIKPRKNNRLRLDSTKEASLHADKGEHKITIQKNKHLPDSDSSSDESISNEREMTICNETIKESDPLLAQIKTEPKTPLRSVNSTIPFIDSEEVDNDCIDKNESTKTQSEFLDLDPLQATMAADCDDDSLSSVDENIIQNYDSVLKDLNKSSKVHAKVCNISLNLDNKSKKKEKPALVDELNLTQVKSEKPKNKQKKKPSTSVNKILPQKDDDDASSDSIDLHLLFSEDSNSSDTSSLQNKMKAANTNSEEIIPLKRKEAKTDIRESKDLAMDKSVDKSLSKTPTKGNSEDARLEISYQKEKSSKGKSKAQDNIDIVLDQTDVCDKSTNKSLVKTPSSGKKNKCQSEPHLKEQNENAANQSLNVSKIKTPESQKKTTDIKFLTGNPEATVESKPSNKKHKKTSNSLEVDHKITSDNQEVLIDSETNEKKKRKKTTSNSFAADTTPSILDNQEVPIKSDTNGKKSRKKSGSNSSAADDTESIPVEIPQNIETSSKKRKRNNSSLNTTKEESLPADVDTAKALSDSIVGIKKKKRKIITQDEILSVAETELIAEKLDESCNKKQDKKSASNLQNRSTKIDETNKRRNKKRKEREDDETSSSKVQKVNIFDKVPRLPPTLLEKLEDVPQKEAPSKKPKLVSTTQFHVQEMNKRKNKPSIYLEESVCLNESRENRRNKKKRLDKPKVLPFVPTASISCSGFTTNFKINVLPSDITFGAQSNTMNNFRDNYLYGRKIRKLGTYDTYRKQRNIKLSKY